MIYVTILALKDLHILYISCLSPPFSLCLPFILFIFLEPFPPTFAFFLSLSVCSVWSVKAGYHHLSYHNISSSSSISVGGAGSELWLRRIRMFHKDIVIVIKQYQALLMMKTWVFLKLEKLYQQHKHRNEGINQSGVVSACIRFSLSRQKMLWLTKDCVEINSVRVKIRWISKDRWSEHKKRDGKWGEGNVILSFNQSGRRLVFFLCREQFQLNLVSH